MEVLYSDTDSLVLNIETDDFFKDISGDVKEWLIQTIFQRSPCCFGGVANREKNKKKIGLMKDECGGKILTEWVALRPNFILS